MGAEKFYETPEGRVRAALLLASGVQYDRESVEHRLLERHLQQEAAYRHYFDFWLSDVFMNLFMATAIGAGVTEDSRNAFMDATTKRRNAILDLSDPFGHLKARDARAAMPKATEQDKVAYLQALGSKGGFKSITQLRQAVQALNKTIKDMQNADQPPTASDD